MGVFNFSKLIQIFMPCSFHQDDVTCAVRSLLSLILKLKVCNEHGEPYNITPAYAQEWLDQTRDVFPNIKKAVSYNFEVDEFDDDFEDFITDEVATPFLTNFYDGLLKAAKEDENINPKTLEDIQEAYDSKEYPVMFRICYHYALCANNKLKDKRRKKAVNLSEIYGGLVGHKPTPLDVPEDIKDEEMPYVNELLLVYSEKERANIVDSITLSSFPASLSDLERQRKYYYAAETIRVGLRDTELKGTNAFEDFKDEVEEYVIPISQKSFLNGEMRLNTVMEEVTRPNYGSALPKFTDWIRVSEKRGVCHMLVNEGKIKWVKKDE